MSLQLCREVANNQECYEMTSFVQIIRVFSGREEGQTLTEYGLLLFFIAIVVIAVVTLLGEQLSSFFDSVTNSFSDSG
jgi:pilus assembly protein Flp/PilA